jgi:hypothetical protein
MATTNSGYGYDKFRVRQFTPEDKDLPVGDCFARNCDLEGSYEGSQTI